MSGLGQLPCSSGTAPPGHDATAATAKNDDDDDDDVDEKVVAARRPVAAAASRDELNFIRRRSVIIFCFYGALLFSRAVHRFSVFFLSPARILSAHQSLTSIVICIMINKHESK
jgi:hypothetical protein